MIEFSGSYTLDEVQFLLKPIQLKSTSIAEKEYLIQSGKKHYSEMISTESLPSAAYLQLFERIFAQNKQRLANDILSLANKIHHAKPDTIVLISLARAGTPIGILLKKILQQYFARECVHYSLSIIRDRGIDYNALHYILKQHPDENSLLFIDGWTGKGVITQELKHSIAQFNQQFNTHLCADLYVLNDIAGVAAVSASYDDYLIPSSLLNATISGLISRSILNHEVIGKEDFHGCIYYTEFAHHDLSRWFIMHMQETIAQIVKQPIQFHGSKDTQQQAQQRSELFIAELQKTYGIENINLIKPGIGEATRVLLRRVPDLLILKNKDAPQTEHLVLLAREKQVPIIQNVTLPYQAVSIISNIK